MASFASPLLELPGAPGKLSWARRGAQASGPPSRNDLWREPGTPAALRALGRPSWGAFGGS
eukprot:15377816-Alexandrium_andersonii.AAC.1